MRSCFKSFTCCASLSALCLIVAGLSFFSAEWYFPLTIGTATVGLLTIDTPEKFAVLGAERTLEQTIVMFNLTNAYELQTVTPPPKPIFQEVSVTFTVKTEAFDYELASDELTYSHKTWSYLEPKTASDGLLEIVQLNSVLPALLAQVGGEATLKATYDYAAASGAVAGSADPVVTLSTGCAAINAANPDPVVIQGCVGISLMYAALAGEKALPLKPDGTGALGVGLFVRRTINQMINGFEKDPLTQQPNPGSTLGYNLYPTREALEAALAAGSDTAAKFTSTKMTGKGNPEDLGKWVSQHSFSNVSAVRNQPFWLIPPTLYDNHGSTSSGLPFIISGLRSSAQPMAPTTAPPSVLSAGYPPKAQPTTRTLEYFDDLFTFRPVTYSCGACTHEALHGVLNVVKYTWDESNGHLKTDGTRDVGGACALTGTCDHGSLLPSVWSTPVLSYTLPYFGNSSNLLTDAVTFKSSTGEILSYEDETMRNELYIEPFSGAPVKVRSMMQINMNGMSPAVFNGALYSNVFATGLPAVWPISLAVTDFEASAAEASLIGSPLSTVYLLMLLTDVWAFWMILNCLFFARKARTLQKANRTAPLDATNSKSSKKSASKTEKRDTNRDTEESVSA